ncbi:hypothetical protein OAM96_02510 [Candidatus Poseidoniaceae archaeon]|nr:hypothetical protein [Candidatus Poseidoniaceae archaeon]
MGLLDKAGNVGTKADEKPKAVAKAVAKAAPKAVAKPKAAAKTTVSAKPVKAKKVKTPRTTGLPEGYELASKMNRSISWWVNIAVNFSVLLGGLGMVIFADTGATTTALFGVAAVMIILNVIVIPAKTGRTIGHFVSRTKFMTANGEKASVFHSILANTVGLFTLIGFMLVMFNISDFDSKNYWGIGGLVVGIIFIVLWFVNRNFKKNSDMDQGLYDLLFRAYLVKHIPAEGEVSTGIWGRLENAGEWGDKIASRREDNIKKAAAKAAAKAEKAEKDAKEAKDAEEAEDAEDATKDSTDSSKDE